MTQFEFNFKSPKAGLFNQTEIQGRAAANMGCCGIFALSNSFGIDIDQAFEWFKLNRKAGARYQGCTSIKNRKDFCMARGLAFEDVELNKRQKLKTVLKKLDPSQHYIITITRHVLIYRDGQIIDQCGSHDARTELVESGDANRIVKSVWKI
jgi:hypothetical protein